jgi:hypothetical protein
MKRLGFLLVIHLTLFPVISAHSWEKEYSSFSSMNTDLNRITLSEKLQSAKCRLQEELVFDYLLPRAIPGLELATAAPIGDVSEMKEPYRHYAGIAEGCWFGLEFEGNGAVVFLLQVRSPYSSIHEWAESVVTTSQNSPQARFVQIGGLDFATFDEQDTSIFVAIRNDVLIIMSVRSDTPGRWQRE